MVEQLATMYGIYAGKKLGSQEFHVSQNTVQYYIDGLNLENPWYNTYSPFGEPVTPALFIAEYVSPRQWYSLPSLFGNLWARQEWELWSPIKIGDHLIVTGQIKDVYPRRDRTVVANEVLIQTKEGNTVARGAHHHSFIMSTASGEASLQDPKSKTHRNDPINPKGEALQSLTRTITLDMCKRFEEGQQTFHTDLETAKNHGFKDVIVSGRMSEGCISELLTNSFGRGWFCGGRLDLKFVNPWYVNELVTFHGVVTGHTQEGNSATRTHIALWGSKQDGSKVVVATASALNTK